MTTVARDKNLFQFYELSAAPNPAKIPAISTKKSAGRRRKHREISMLLEGVTKKTMFYIDPGRERTTE